MIARALLIVSLAATGCKDRREAPRELPPAPLALDLGQEPLVNPLNLWEMMIDGGPDHETVGFVGDRRVTTAELDERSDDLLERIGDRIYLARDRGWRALLEAEGLRRAAAAADTTVVRLMADEYGALPAPTEAELDTYSEHEAMAGVEPESRRDAARSLWRLHRWMILRSVLIAEGLRDVPRERAQLMLVNPAFAGADTAIGAIGDRVVTRADLHLAAGYAEQAARREYVTAARMLFEDRARELVLAMAAAERGIGAEQLVAAEIAALGKPPAAEVAAFVAEHPEYEPHPHRAVDAVRTLREAAATEALVARLGAQLGGVRFVLEEPPFDRISPELLAPRRAGAGEAANLIEILHCVGGPTCARGSELARSIVDRYGERARIELGDYFSGLDAIRLRHALALRCAEDQERGWAMLERLLDSPTRGGSAELVAAATAAGLEAGPFEACLGADRHLPLVVEDSLRAEQLGLELNIVGIWVNGTRLDRLGDPGHVQATVERLLR